VDAGEVFPHEPDRHRALADGRCDPLDRTAAHGAGGGHARPARLEQEPLVHRLRRRGHRRIAQDVTLTVVLVAWFWTIGVARLMAWWRMRGVERSWVVGLNGLVSA
jgi:hypothetical protein